MLFSLSFLVTFLHTLNNQEVQYLERSAQFYTKEFEDDVVAIEQDEDNAATAKDVLVLKQERRAAFYKSMMDLQRSFAPVASSSSSIVVRENTKQKLESCSSKDIHNYTDKALDSLTSSKLS